MIKIHYHIVWFDEKHNSSNPQRNYKQAISIAANSTYNDCINCIISEFSPNQSDNQFNNIPTQIEENRNCMIITIGTKAKTDDDLTKQKLLNNQIVNINDIVNVSLDKCIYFICGTVTQKRKAKECVDDANTIEPNRKRRKITNHNDAKNKLDKLIKSHKSHKLVKKENEELNHKLIKQNKQIERLKQEREHYQQGVRIYKSEAGKWKSECLKLQSRLNQLFNDNDNVDMDNNNIECEIECENSNNAKPPKRKVDRTTKSATKSSNNTFTTPSITDSNSEEDRSYQRYLNPQENRYRNRKRRRRNPRRRHKIDSDNDSVPSISQESIHNDNKLKRKKSLSKTVTYNLRSKNIKPKLKTKIKCTNSNKYQFNNSCYCMSIDCYICKQHFDNNIKYKDHIKQHYNNDTSKQWLKCNFDGCHQTFPTDQSFVYHISSHTKDYFYKCIIETNGNKCIHQSANTGNMKNHWNAHHKNKSESSVHESSSDESSSDKSNNNNKDRNSESESDNESESDIGNDFENSYLFEMNCHCCQKQFNDYSEYRKHIKQYYDNHSSKKWGFCDFGCLDNNTKQKFIKTNINFIGHINWHTNQKPFVCNQKQCNVSTRMKAYLKQHWKKIHSKQQNNTSKMNTNTYLKDNFFYRCHICRKGFCDLYAFRMHSNGHRGDDEWVQCGEDCRGSCSYHRSI